MKEYKFKGRKITVPGILGTLAMPILEPHRPESQKYVPPPEWFVREMNYRRFFSHLFAGKTGLIRELRGSVAVVMFDTGRTSFGPINQNGKPSKRLTNKYAKSNTVYCRPAKKSDATVPIDMYHIQMLFDGTDKRAGFERGGGKVKMFFELPRAMVEPWIQPEWRMVE